MFILGVGAQKSGTTWLWKQLARHLGHRSLGLKELHYWDERIRLHSQDLRDEQAIQSFMTDESVEAITSVNHDQYFTPIKQAQRVQRWKLQTRPIVADITPAYAGLPRGVFRLIRKELELRRMDYRVIYFMRDPVARIVSAFNMRLRKGQVKRAGQEVLLPQMKAKITVESPVQSEDFAEEIIRYGRSWHCQCRTRYEITVTNLREVFPPDRLFFGFNESISDSLQIEGLSKFLNLPVSLFNPAQVVHRGGRLGRYHLPSADVRDELHLLYQSTYEEILEEFPEVSQLWGESGPNTTGTA